MSAGPLSAQPERLPALAAWPEPPSLPALDAALALLQASPAEVHWEQLTQQFRQLAVSLAQQQRPASSWYALTLALAAVGAPRQPDGGAQAVGLLQVATDALRGYLEWHAADAPAAYEDARELLSSYRLLADLAGLRRIEASDLWAMSRTDWQWLDLAPVGQDNDRLEPDLYETVLRLFRSHGGSGTRELFALAGARMQQGDQPESARAFWQLLAGVTQLLALAVLPWDLFARRLLAGVVTRQTRLEQGQPDDEAVRHRLAGMMLYLLHDGMARLPPGSSATLARALASHYGVLPLQQEPVVVQVDITPQRAWLQKLAACLPADELRGSGEQRLPIHLYNCFLQDADDWSRQLLVTLQEWALEPGSAFPEAAIGLAEQLASGAAAVGLQELATLAHGMERALHGVRCRRSVSGQGLHTLRSGAEVLRLGLHQFAAGLSRPLPPALLRELAALAVPSRHARTVLPLVEWPSLVQLSAPEAAAAPTLTVHAPAVPEQRRQARAAVLRQVLLDEVRDRQIQLQAVLRHWQARPDNEGAGAECLRLLQSQLDVAQQLEDGALQAAIRQAMGACSLVRATGQGQAGWLAELQLAVAAIDTALQPLASAA